VSGVRHTLIARRLQRTCAGEQTRGTSSAHAGQRRSFLVADARTLRGAPRRRSDDVSPIPDAAPGLSLRRRAARRRHVAGEHSRAEAFGGVPSDRGFGALRTTFRATGGIARGDDLARLLEYLNREGAVSLARLISSGEVFGFAWRETWWIPMFQFSLRDLSLSRQSQAVLAELSGAYAGWSLACWFAEPNEWLQQRRPVELLDSDLAAVLGAARTDRFVANG
jgi:hypothetical protein